MEPNLELDPTLTPEMNPVFAILIVVPILVLLVVELFGVFNWLKAKRKGDTITEGYRWVVWQLASRSPVYAWLFRIFGIGMGIWAVAHLGFGAS